MTISKELLDELLKGCERPEDLLGDAGLMKELKIRLMERMLGAELTAHLGYEDENHLFYCSKLSDYRAGRPWPDLIRTAQRAVKRGYRRQPRLC